MLDKSNKQVPMEKSIVTGILKFLNSLPVCHARKVAGTDNQAGEPDIDACYHGQTLKLEVKRPKPFGNDGTKLQLATLEKWKAAGAIAGIVRSVDDVKAIIQELDNGRKEPK